MKNVILSAVLLVIGAALFTSCDKSSPEPNPIVGEWHRQYYQLTNLPITHKNFEGLIIADEAGTSDGIYGEKSYYLTLNNDKTFTSRFIYTDLTDLSESGKWTLDGNVFRLDYTKSTLSDQEFSMNGNSGTKIAFHQKQQWMLLPDKITDTLTSDYYYNNEEMIYNKYSTKAELTMNYCFKKMN